MTLSQFHLCLLLHLLAMPSHLGTRLRLISCNQLSIYSPAPHALHLPDCSGCAQQSPAWVINTDHACPWFHCFICLLAVISALCSWPTFQPLLSCFLFARFSLIASLCCSCCCLILVRLSVCSVVSLVLNPCLPGVEWFVLQLGPYTTCYNLHDACL